MVLKSKRQRYTRQWKHARRSLDERFIGEESSDHPITPHSITPPPITPQHINYIDEDISSVIESVEIGVGGQSCSSGPDRVDDGLSEGNCISETESENKLHSQHSYKNGQQNT